MPVSSCPLPNYPSLLRREYLFASCADMCRPGYSRRRSAIRLLVRLRAPSFTLHSRHQACPICETAVAALKSNTLAWKDVPHGILTLAEMLHVHLQGFSLESAQDIAAEAALSRG